MKTKIFLELKVKAIGSYINTHTNTHTRTRTHTEDTASHASYINTHPNTHTHAHTHTHTQKKGEKDKQTGKGSISNWIVRRGTNVPCPRGQGVHLLIRGGTDPNQPNPPKKRTSCQLLSLLFLRKNPFGSSLENVLFLGTSPDKGWIKTNTNITFLQKRPLVTPPGSHSHTMCTNARQH